MVLDKKSLIIACFVALMMIQGVSAMSCVYDSRPYISVSGKTVDWLCQLDTPSECYGVVMYPTDSELVDVENVISISPDPKFVDQYGKIDTFKSENLFVNIKFSSLDLVEGLNYTFKAVCVSPTGTEEYSDIISPTYSELRSTPYIFSYIIKNSAEIVLVVIFLVVASVIYYMYRRR